MATADRNPGSPLIRELLQEPQHFRFFTAVRLLERALHGKSEVGSGATPGEEAVRFVPTTSLGFPGSDLVGAEWADRDQSQFRLIVSFLGLYGVASPLPAYFQQVAAGEDSGAAALRDFLNIFNQRVYALYYRAWKKHRLADAWDARGGRSELMLAAASGLAVATRPAALQFDRLYASAGLIGAAVRSAAGLQSVLTEYFRLPVQVMERIPQWRENLSPVRLGDPSRTLGRSISIGSKLRDISGCFGITLGPLTVEESRRFLPESSSQSALAEIVRLFVADFPSYELRLAVYGHQAPAVRLGTTDAPLGWLSWLGNPGEMIQTVSFGHFETC